MPAQERRDPVIVPHGQEGPGCMPEHFVQLLPFGPGEFGLQAGMVEGEHPFPPGRIQLSMEWLAGVLETPDPRLPVGECRAPLLDLAHEAVEARLVLRQDRVSGMKLDLQRLESRARHARIVEGARGSLRPGAAAL